MEVNKTVTSKTKKEQQMPMSQSQKDAIREGVKRYYETHSGPMTGKSMSDASKEKIRSRLQDYYATHSGPQTGKPMSDATKEKIRQAMLKRYAKVTE
jgi:hypothetical protein